MIVSFKTKATKDIFYGVVSKAARKACPQNVWPVASRKLEMLDSAERLVDLKIPPGNRLEALSGARKGQHSIRINEQYRLSFVWTASGPADVEITDYH